MKKQNQAIGVAKEAARQIYEWGGSCPPPIMAQIIRRCIDAATAEVKKEGSLGSETHATMGVVSEQTGDTERLNWIEKNPNTLSHCTWMNFSVGRCWDFQNHGDKTIGECKVSLREAIDLARSVQGSEVPTQKAPTAPSRKQEVSGLAARVEPTKWKAISHGGKDSEPHDIYYDCRDGTHLIELSVTKAEAERICAAHNASCAVKEEEEEEDLGLR